MIMKTTEEWLIANLRSVGKCAVVVYLLWSICICVVVQYSTGLRVYIASDLQREEFQVTSKYLPEIYTAHIKFVIVV